jgi:Transglutaminase-like superfamily
MRQHPFPSRCCLCNSRAKFARESSDRAAGEHDTARFGADGDFIMASMKAFAALSAPDRGLLLRALFLVAAVRTGLFLLPFRTVRRLTARAGRRPVPPYSVGRCAWAVRASSRYVPGATCLTQALAAQVLLAESGYDSRIEIGVTKDEHRRFRAHAWVVCGEEIVIGGAEAYRYVPLAAWDASMRRTN